MQGCEEEPRTDVVTAGVSGRPVMTHAIPGSTGTEQGMGRWVMDHGSNGSRKSDGSHGSWVTRC